MYILQQKHKRLDSSNTRKAIVCLVFLLIQCVFLHMVYSYLRIAEGYVLIAVYLFIYLDACYSQNSKSIEPNRMEFGGMIVYYPGTSW